MRVLSSSWTLTFHSYNNLVADAENKQIRNKITIVTEATQGNIVWSFQIEQWTTIKPQQLVIEEPNALFVNPSRIRVGGLGSTQTCRDLG